MNRLRILSVTSVFLALGCNTNDTLDSAFRNEAGSWIDLTHPLSTEAIFWPTAKPFEMEEVAYGPTPGGFFYAAYNIAMAEHGGTHLDAPIHFAEGRQTADQIPLDKLMGPAVVIDVSATSTPDYLVTVADITSWEEQNGPIPGGAIVLFLTGWGTRWPDRLRYLGTEETGEGAVPQLHFPGIAPAAAQWLLDNRTIDAVGIDTPSIDFGQSTLFETHQILYGANIPGFENVANLERLPPSGAYVMALPTRIEGGSGAPLRIVAYVPDA